jgi:hypothetical protein
MKAIASVFVIGALFASGQQPAAPVPDSPRPAATFSGSERESDETATFTQLSSPAELRGTDVGHRHPLGHG